MSATAGGGRLGVVVVNFGSHALLERNLVPLHAAAAEQILVVVVDNFSTPAERAAVGALCADHGWELVAPDGNTGFGAGANAGAARALARGCDTLLLLNPDASIAAADAADLTARVRRRPASLISPVITRPDGSVWFDGNAVDPRRGRTVRRGAAFRSTPTAWLTAACLFAGRELWTAVGGFDEAYFLYWEDVDLSARWLAHGGSLEVASDVTAVHDVGGTQLAADTAGRAKSTTYYYYNCRNRLLYAARWLPTRAVLGWCVRTPVESGQILLRGGRRQLLGSPRPLLAAVGGSVAGLAIAGRELGRRLLRRPVRRPLRRPA